MPIYEYQCGECGEVFEKMLLGKAKDPEACPTCGSNKIGRMISNTSFHLKGGGWYVTDYAGKKSVPSSSKGEGRADGSSSESSGEGSSSAKGADTGTSDKATKSTKNSEGGGSSVA